MTVYMILLPIYSMPDESREVTVVQWTNFGIVADLEEAKRTADSIHGIVVTLHEAP